MDEKLINQVSDQVYRKFSEVKGSHPEICPQGSNTLLIYSGIAQGSDGKSIPRIVRVVVDTKGKILKMTTSR